jgi:hypothetical protein
MQTHVVSNLGLSRCCLLSRRACVLLAAALACLQLACPSAMSPQVVNMAPRADARVAARTAQPIEVLDVYGGEESDPMWKGSRIDRVSFRKALAKALFDAGYNVFESRAGQPTYQLSARIVDQVQPVAGLNMTVALRVRYTLSSLVDAGFRWEKDVSSAYTATVGEAFVGAERLNKANEGAVRKNLERLLEELVLLQL